MQSSIATNQCPVRLQYIEMSSMKMEAANIV